MIDNTMAVNFVLSLIIFYIIAQEAVTALGDIDVLGYSIKSRMMLKFLGSIVIMSIVIGTNKGSNWMISQVSSFFMMHFVLSLILMGQLRLRQVFDNQSLTLENRLLGQVSPGKNIETGADKGAVANLIFMLVILSVIYATAVQGINIANSPAGLLVGRVWSWILVIFDRAFYYLVQIAFLIIGPLLKWIAGKSDWDQFLSQLRGNQGPPQDNGPIENNMASGSIMSIIPKLALAVLIVFIAYRMYRSISFKKRKTQDYEEDKEYIFSISDGLKNIKKSLNKLLKNRFLGRRNTNLHPLRKLYIRILKLLKEKGVNTKTWDTPLTIFERAKGTYPDIEEQLSYITEQYCDLRYGEKQNCNLKQDQKYWEEIAERLKNRTEN